MKIIEEEKTQLEMGIEVEKEHKNTYQKIKDFYKENGYFPKEEDVYSWIAQNHIDEFPSYYTELKIMEDKLKNKG
jgi:hypothetical protein